MSQLYEYYCLPEAGGCGQEFKDHKPDHARHEVQCPNCMMYGGEMFTHPVHHSKMYRIQIVHTAPPGLSKSIDCQDGRTMEPVEMPGLLPGEDGKPRRVSSRKELEDLKKRTREEYFKATDGDHRVLKEYVDDNGKVVKDFHTTTTKGTDIGELHPIEERGEGNRIMSPFPGGEGKTLEQHEAELARRVGPPEHPEKP